jgi:DNA-binding MarR family transcriptional regulator
MVKKAKSSEIPAALILAQLERLARLSRAASHSASLNPAQWDALRYLARANRFSNSPIALTHYLGATKGTISQTLSALEKKLMISKSPRAGDSRSVVLMVTELGHKIMGDDPLQHLETAIAALSDKTRRRFARGVAVLLEGERQRQKQPAFGSCPSCRFFREKGAASSEAPHFCMAFDAALSVDDTQLICVEFEKA